MIQCIVVLFALSLNYCNITKNALNIFNALQSYIGNAVVKKGELIMSPIKIDTSANNKYQVVDTSLGKILVFRKNVGNMSDTSKELDADIKDVSADEYLKVLIKYICCTESEFNGERPTLPTSFQEQINLLTEEDLEKIAGAIVENSDHLTHETIDDSYVNDEGVTVVRHKTGEIKNPKLPDENNIDYLHRLEIKSHEELNERFKKMTSGFSSQINLNLGKVFEKQQKLFDSIGKSSVEKIGESLRNYNFAESVADCVAVTPEKYVRPEMFIPPVNPLVEKINTMNENFAKVVDYNADMSNVQIEIAAELNGAVKSAKKSTRFNMLITALVLLITIASLIITAYGTLTPNKEMAKSVGLSEEMLSKFDALIEATSQNRADGEFLNKLQKDIDTLKSENLKLRNELGELKAERTNK